MLPTYPSMTSTEAPYPYQSTRSDPNDTSTCKPVAIISHNHSLTLITCLQTNKIKDNHFICQHQRQLSDVSGVPRATLLQDLQRRSCCVYTLNPDGTAVQEQMEECKASKAALTELKPDDLNGLTGTGDEQVNNSKPSDLGLYEVDEEKMLQLLPPELLASTSDFSQAALTSAALNQGASTSAQALSLTATALLNQPPVTVALTQGRIIGLSSLTLSEKRTIYCILDVLESNKGKQFTKWQLIDAMKEKYMNFDTVQSDGSHNRAFACAIKLDLIEKSVNPAKPNGVIYALGKYGSAAFQYIKQQVVPTLTLRAPAATHLNNDQ